MICIESISCDDLKEFELIIDDNVHNTVLCVGSRLATSANISCLVVSEKTTIGSCIFDFASSGNSCTSSIILQSPNFGEAPEITIKYSVSVNISFFPRCIWLGHFQGSYYSEDVYLEFRLMKKSTVIKRHTVSGCPVICGDSYIVDYSGKSLYIEDAATYSTTLEIILLNSERREIRLVDVFPIEAHKTIYPVGNDEGTVVFDNTYMRPSPTSCLSVAKIEINCVDEFSSILSVIAGYGYLRVCNLNTKIVTSVVGKQSLVELEYYAPYSTTDTPTMAGFLIRDKVGSLVSIYTIPLIHQSVYTFENVDMRVSLKEVGCVHLPITESANLFSPLKPGLFARLKLTIHSLRISGANQIESVASRFVCVQKVACTICPILLKMSEVIDMQKFSQKQEVNSGSSSCTPTRRGNLIFESDLQIDFPYNENDWLYFVLFENKEDLLGPIAHACMPMYATEDHLTLPVLSDEGEIILLMNISFPCRPVSWGPVYIKQETACLNEGEVCLRVKIVDIDPMCENHAWLPIRDFSRLYIRNCPPTGSMKIQLERLNGSIIAKTVHHFTMRDNSFVCGQIKFSYSRS